MDFVSLLSGVHVCAKSLQSCVTYFDPMDCSPPGSSVRGILQARILEWAAISSSRGSSQPRGRTRLSCFLHWQEDSLPRAPPMISHVAQMVKNLPAFQEPWRCGFDPWVGRIPWRKTRQPTLVFLPGESHGPRSLAGYGPWGCRVGRDCATEHAFTLSS